MKKFLIIMLGFFMLGNVWSQISGTVTDENDFPVSDAVVENQENQVTTYTDFDGNYEIEAEEGQTLMFYSPNGIEKTVVVGNEATMNVQLTSTVQLKEVVAVGYGTQDKELVSAAVSSVESEEIMENNPTTVGQALQGKSSGVQVNQSSGTPGSSPSIRIRGITTNGDNSPLVVLDGVIMGTDISVIDPNDIEKIDVVKDASTAIYGVQGQNGVILITSKSGGKNRGLSFTYNGNYTIQEADNLLDLMNGREYAAYWNESEIADGNALPFPNFQSFENGTDWQAQLFETSPSTQHYLSATGGNKWLSFGLSGSYLDQKSIIAPDKANYERLTFKNDLGINITENLKLSTMILYTDVERRTIPVPGPGVDGRGSVIYYADNASPLDPVYDGSTIGTTPSNGFYYVNQSSQEMINPMAVIYNTFNRTDVERYTGKVELAWEPIEKLELTSRYNFNDSDVTSTYFNPLVYYGPGKVNNNVSLLNPGTASATFNLDANENGFRDVFPIFTINYANYFDWSWESFATYKKSFGANNFDFMVGTALRKETGDAITRGGKLIYGNSWEEANLSNTLNYTPDPDIDRASSMDRGIDVLGRYDNRTISYFGRIQYDYAGKYLLSAILRRDASTKFGSNNRVGYFPSFSAGWVVSKEDFFNADFVNKFKLRASWGITGNDKIDANAWRALMQINPEAEYPYGNSLLIGSALGRLGNPDLKWETTTQTDIGFDLTLFNRSVDIVFDYFLKDTEDLLLAPEVLAITGAYAPGSGQPIQNVGNVRNQGVELSVNYNHDFSEDFSFNTGVNFLYLDNEVTQTNGADIYGGIFGLSTKTSRMTVGAPMGAFFGLVADGIFQNQAEVDAHAYQQGAQPGDIRYLDLDGDGTVEFGSEDDIKQIGNPIPDFTIGFNLGTNYKAFDFSTSLYASIGNDIVRAYERFQPFNNKLSYYLDRWTGEGTSNEVPRASNAAARNTEFSSFFVEDGSFLRIQNVQIGYDFTQIFKDTGFDKARLYFAVNNLYTFTNYKGYTPEIDNSSPLNAGVDGGQFPTVRTFVTGLTLNF